VVIMIMFMIGTRWSEPDEEVPSNAVRPSADGGAADRVPWRALTAAMLVLVIGLPRWASTEIHASGAEVTGLQLPALAGTTEAALPIDYAPVFILPTAQTQRSYGVGDQVVTVHVAYYRQQTYERKLSSSLNLLAKFDDPRWHQVSEARRSLTIGRGVVDVREAELRAGGVAAAGNQTSLYVRQVFWVDGHLTASPSWATLYTVAAQLMGRGDDSAAFTVYVASTDAQAANRTVDEFLSRQLPVLTQALEAVRDKR
jgi:EpsI family protein